MFGSEILDVVIGLVMIYLLGSLICSAIKEGIARISNLRARTLETEIWELLRSGQLVEKVYSNPLLKTVRQGLFWKGAPDAGNNATPPAAPGKKTEYIPNADFAAALVETVLEFKQVKDGADQKFTELCVEVEKIPYAPVRNALTDLMTDIRAGAADVDKKAREARAAVENWFDGAMKKLSYWYKQKTKLIIFFVGVIVCGAFNLDTIMIARTLYSNQSLRDVIVQTAQKAAAEDPKNINIPEIEEKLQEAGFPLGWKHDPFPGNNPLAWWLYKIFGLLITSLALSLGAPFWYETLTRLLEFRKAVKSDKKE